VHEPARPSVRSIWLTRRALISTGVLLLWVPGCAAAAWWQVGIALGGDGLGWVYSVMWPCFAVFGAVFWWFLVHDDPDTLGARGLRAAGAGAPTPETMPAPRPSEDAAADRLARAEAEDPELAAYNAYLAALAGDEKTWRRRRQEPLIPRRESG
jgi:hypothetical protein